MTTPMTTDPDQILHQLFSPAFPVGAFAWSHGLETAIAERAIHDAASAQDWIAAALTHGAGWTDAVIAAQAAQGGDPAELSALSAALAPTAERRSETLEQGAAFAATVRAVWGADVANAPYPVAVGAALHVLRLPIEAGIRLMLQGFAANLVSACVRAVPLGQTEGQRITAALLPDIQALATAAVDAEIDAIGGFALALDVASARHETLRSRLFRS
jgi:urease accessory protein